MTEIERKVYLLFLISLVYKILYNIYDISLYVSSVAGYPVPTVSWVKDGAVLRIGAGISTQQEDGLHLLCVENVQKTDAGQYSCTATNSKGKATCSWTLTVKSKCVHLFDV